MEVKQIPVYAERDRNGTYTINFLENGNFKVFRCGCDEAFDENNYLQSNGDEPLKITSPYPQERLVFAVSRNESPEYFYVSERHIPLEGTPNFRDLGGFITDSGRQVKWGTFFRSGMLSLLTETDLEYFKTLNIKTIIDFRSEIEAQTEPDKFPEGFGVKRIASPIGNPADFEKLAESTKKNAGAQEAVREIMMAGASAFVSVLEDFSPVFDCMKEGKPFLFHCSAGKDRTGLAAALVLLTLGVNRATAIEDYLLSNKYTIPFFSKHLNLITELGISKDIAIAASGVNREFLEKTLDTIDEKFGGFGSMLEKKFGIDQALREKLIKKHTFENTHGMLSNKYV